MQPPQSERKTVTCPAPQDPGDIPMSRLPDHLDIHLIRILYLLLCEKNVSRVALKLNQPQPSI
jgi:hypothetical protein